MDREKLDEPIKVEKGFISKKIKKKNKMKTQYIRINGKNVTNKSPSSKPNSFITKVESTMKKPFTTSKSNKVSKKSTIALFTMIFLIQSSCCLSINVPHLLGPPSYFV